MSFRFRGQQALVEEDAPWPRCGWTDEEGWQDCRRDARVAQFDEGELIFRCAHHRAEDTYVWPLVESEEAA